MFGIYKMKKIVITGATSMIGIALIEQCIKKNIEVLAIVRKKLKISAGYQ